MKSERSADPDSTEVLVENFFRHEYGRLVAVLGRQLGHRDIELIEDAVQSALMSALEAWPISGRPTNPSAWLFRVAKNNLWSILRQTGRRRRILEERREELLPLGDLVFPSHEEIQDDLLRMLFACCDQALPPASQLVLALKTLCGFSVEEIALRLFTSEANVYKRLGRARRVLLEADGFPAELTSAQFASRVPAVVRVVYLLFTEGYLSSHAEAAVRTELCLESLRLGLLLAESPVGRVPEVSALMALMHLHAARFDARVDGAGALLLLEEQDRELWDVEQIAEGLRWLGLSAEGDRFSRYHAEAGIAAEHCLSPSFAETRWDRIVELYLMLESIAPSPVHRLNRAVATAEWKGAGEGLSVLESSKPPSWLAESYMWQAVLADLHRRVGNAAVAREHWEQAMQEAPTQAIVNLLRRRFEALL